MSRREAVPTVDDDWEKFALQFNAYEHWGSFDTCADLANRVLAEFGHTGELPTDPVQLRTALFFEQRRWRHFGWEPEGEDRTYIQALLDAIRAEGPLEPDER